MIDKREKAEIKAKILEVMRIVTPKPTKIRQIKMLKSGEEREYNRTDYHIRIPSAMMRGKNRPVAIIAWDGFESLLTIKSMYQLTDDELTWIILEIFSEFR